MELIPGQALGQSAGPAPRIILAALGRWSWAKKKPAAHWEPPAAKSNGDEAYHLYVKVARRFVGVPTYTRERLMLAMRYFLSNTLSTFTCAVQLCFEL